MEIEFRNDLNDKIIEVVAKKGCHCSVKMSGGCSGFAKVTRDGKRHYVMPADIGKFVVSAAAEQTLAAADSP